MNTTAEAQDAYEALWDVKDVAKYLKASPSTVYKKAEAGLIPCHRVGALLRFEPSAVRRWALGDSAENSGNNSGRVVSLKRG